MNAQPPGILNGGRKASKSHGKEDASMSIEEQNRKSEKKQQNQQNKQNQQEQPQQNSEYRF